MGSQCKVLSRVLYKNELFIISNFFIILNCFPKVIYLVVDFFINSSFFIISNLYKFELLLYVDLQTKPTQTTSTQTQLFDDTKQVKKLDKTGWRIINQTQESLEG